MTTGTPTQALTRRPVGPPPFDNWKVIVLAPAWKSPRPKLGGNFASPPNPPAPKAVGQRLALEKLHRDE